MELSDLLHLLDCDVSKILPARAQLLRAMADETCNAPTRNYYISCASEIEKALGQEKRPEAR